MAKILIIDDDKAVVESTADMLKSFEFNVITATDGKKGFELADIERPDVIILDWMMPGYSGMQFIKDYRDQGYKTPVLFLTGKGDLSQYQVEALRAGADRVELYTGPYAELFESDPKRAIEKYRPAAEKAHELGLGMNAGHDLNLKNLKPFIKAFPWTAEVSIGHAIVCDSLYLGIQETIQEYLELLKK